MLPKCPSCKAEFEHIEFDEDEYKFGYICECGKLVIQFWDGDCMTTEKAFDIFLDGFANTKDVVTRTLADMRSAKCKYCGSTDVYWQEMGNEILPGGFAKKKWRLLNKSGGFHECLRNGILPVPNPGEYISEQDRRSSTEARVNLSIEPDKLCAFCGTKMSIISGTAYCDNCGVWENTQLSDLTISKQEKILKNMVEAGKLQQLPNPKPNKFKTKCIICSLETSFELPEDKYCLVWSCKSCNSRLYSSREMTANVYDRYGVLNLGYYTREEFFTKYGNAELMFQDANGSQYRIRTSNKGTIEYDWNNDYSGSERAIIQKGIQSFASATKKSVKQPEPLAPALPDPTERVRRKFNFNE